MMPTDDKDALIDYRLQQAADTIELADFLLQSDKLAVAVNRIYYGMYYALTALALENNFETSKHGQLIGWFNKEYVASGKVDTKFGKIVRNAFQSRTKGDYDVFVKFTKAEVESMQDDMIVFIGEIKILLRR